MIQAPNLGIGATFGSDMDLDGDRLLVGAPLDSGGNDWTGSAHVYRRSRGVWEREAYLGSITNEGGEQFGRGVALDGDTIAVGAPAEDIIVRPPGGESYLAKDAGAVYIFNLENGAWVYKSRVVSPNGLSYARFGTTVALDGRRMIVGAYNDHVPVIPGPAPEGVAYSFYRTGSTWYPVDRLVSPTPEPYERFGDRIVIDGDTAIIGSSRATRRDGQTEYPYHGEAHVFVFDPVFFHWTHDAVLTPSAQSASLFGLALALRGDSLLIGAPDGTDTLGSVFHFTRSNGIWTEQSRITAPYGAAADFGQSVAMFEDMAVIGAPGDDSSIFGSILGRRPGAAYIFQMTGAGWTPQVKLPASGRLFGAAAAGDGEHILIGAPETANAQARQNGAVFVFGHCDSPQWQMHYGPVVEAITERDPAQGQATSASLCENTKSLP